jgi:hypothetical protein
MQPVTANVDQDARRSEPMPVPPDAQPLIQGTDCESRKEHGDQPHVSISRDVKDNQAFPLVLRQEQQ